MERKANRRRIRRRGRRGRERGRKREEGKKQKCGERHNNNNKESNRAEAPQIDNTKDWANDWTTSTHHFEVHVCWTPCYKEILIQTGKGPTTNSRGNAHSWLLPNIDTDPYPYDFGERRTMKNISVSEALCQGFLRVLRLPPLLSRLMVSANKTKQK